MAADIAADSDMENGADKDFEQSVSLHLSRRAQPESMLGVCCNLRHTCQALKSDLKCRGYALRMCGKAQANRQWPVVFGTSPWLPGSSPLFFALRATIAAAFVGHWLWSLIRFFRRGFWFVFLTNWCLTLETVYFCFAAFTAFVAYSREEQPQEEATGEVEGISLPWYVKVTWISFHLAMPASLIVCVLYWTLENPLWALSSTPEYLNVFMHFINFLLCTLDLLMGRNLFYLRHATVFFILVTAYVAWSGIHFAARIGTGFACKAYAMTECPIYSVLDWHHPISTGIMVIVIVCIVAPCCQVPVWWCVLKRQLIDSYLASREAAAKTEVIEDDLEHDDGRVNSMIPL